MTTKQAAGWQQRASARAMSRSPVVVELPDLRPGPMRSAASPPAGRPMFDGVEQALEAEKSAAAVAGMYGRVDHGPMPARARNIADWLLPADVTRTSRWALVLALVVLAAAGMSLWILIGRSTPPAAPPLRPAAAWPESVGDGELVPALATSEEDTLLTVTVPTAPQRAPLHDATHMASAPVAPAPPGRQLRPGWNSHEALPIARRLPPVDQPVHVAALGPRDAYAFQAAGGAARGNDLSRVGNTQSSRSADGGSGSSAGPVIELGHPQHRVANHEHD